MNKYLEKIAAAPLRRFEQVGTALKNRLLRMGGRTSSTTGNVSLPFKASGEKITKGSTEVTSINGASNRYLNSKTVKALNKDRSNFPAFQKGFYKEKK